MKLIGGRETRKPVAERLLNEPMGLLGVTIDWSAGQDTELLEK